MRILQFHTVYREPGGEDAVVATERRVLETAGHEVVVHHFHNPEGGRDTALALAAAPWNLRRAREAVAVADRVRPDVVHVHNTWFRMSPASLRALARAGHRVVVSLHNYRTACVNSLLSRDDRICTECVGTLPWRGVVHRCYRESAVASSAVALTATTMRWSGALSRDVRAVSVLTPFAAEIAQASGIPADRIVVRDNMAADPGPRTRPPSAGDEVLMVGRLSPEKGHALVLDAWGRAAPAGLRLVVLGGGPLEASLRAAAPDGVEFAGRVEPAEVAERLARARALVFASNVVEGQSIALLEALAAGLPVLASDHPPVRTTLTAGGILVPPVDVAAWTEALARLASPDGLDDMGIAGRRLYEARFSEAAGLAALEALYERAR
jgi:glycosyltransferase involved in cell wall biosynthesis